MKIHHDLHVVEGRRYSLYVYQEGNGQNWSRGLKSEGTHGYFPV